MSDLNLIVPLDVFRGAAPVTGIGFRVIARGWNHWDHDGIIARNPNEPPTFASVANHLCWMHLPTPWVSVYSNWLDALRKAAWYTANGANDIRIVVIDLEKPNTTMLSAQALQEHIGCSNSNFHKYELLVHQGVGDDVNDGAAITYIPMVGEYVDIDVHLGRIRVHHSVIDQAGGQTEADIRRWVEREVYSGKGVEPYARFAGEMAKRRNADDDVASSTPRKSRRTEQANVPTTTPSPAVTPSNRKSILKGTPTRANGTNGIEATPSSLRKVLFSTPARPEEENSEDTPTAIRNDRSAHRKSARTLQQQDGDEDSEDEQEFVLAKEILDEEAADGSEDNETAPSSTATTPKKRGRPPGKKRDRTPSPPPDLPAHEQYFFQNRTGGNKTSSNTLPSHLLLNHEDYYTQINSLSDPHKADIARLKALHERAFGQWVFELSQNFNLCLYGYGSKRNLAMDFAQYLHSHSDKPRKIVVINGYTPGLTLTDIFQCIYRIQQGLKTVSRFTNPEILIEAIIELANLHPPPAPLTIIFHSVDHFNLRTNRLMYPLLSLLASHPSVNLIATCDNPRFGMCWNSAVLKAFRWVYHDATTFEPYTAELDVVEDVHQLLGRGRRRLGGKDGVAYVLKSLPENARNLFRILVAEQLALMEVEPSTVAGAAFNGYDDEIIGDEDEEVAAREQGTPSKRGRAPKPKKPATKPVSRLAVSTPEGVEYRTLYNKAVEEFVCSSELNFRTLLKEFHDHQMIESRKDALGTERLVVPFGKEELETVLLELV